MLSEHRRLDGTQYRRPRRPWTPEPRRRRGWRWWLALFAVVGAFVTVPRGALAYGPSPVSGFATAGGFVLVSVQGLLNTVPVAAGDLVFGDTLYLQFVNFEDNRTIDVTTAQTQTGVGPNASVLWGNESFPVEGRFVTTLTFNLPSTVEVRSTRLCMDGGCMTFEHQTPKTLIPSGVLNVGGLELVAFSLVLEFFVLIIPLLIVARALCRKALWTPKATLLTVLALPHIIGGLLLATLIDYPLVDAVFSGSEFLLWPPMFATFAFFWSLHLFNVAEPAFVLRPDPQGGHRLRFNAWAIFVGDLSDGTKILIGTRWRDWLARLFGHATVLVPANVDGTKEGGAAESNLTWFTIHSRRFDWRRFRATPGHASPLDDFVVAGSPVGETGSWSRSLPRPKWLYWVDSDAWLDTDLPYLSWTRPVKVDAVLAADGSVRKPATTKNKLSLPHYVDPPAGKMRLASIHYLDAILAALGWIKAERAYRRIRDLTTQVAVLRATLFVTAQDMAEEEHAELLRMLQRESRPLSDVEAEEETRTEAPTTAKGTTTAEEAQGSDRPGKVPPRRGRPEGT
ncbi:MAG: hypothetical protein L3K23_10480 [Thermoplasmata archaeon]|nr:hypothetical protein [Thermoplasmata archaeon]